MSLKKAAEYILIGTIVFLTLAVGGVFVWTEWVAFGALTVGCVLYAVERQRKGRSARLPHIWWLGVFLFVWTLLLALPLPSVLVRLLAPATYDVQQRLAELTGGSDSLVPLSLNPGATLISLRKLYVFLAAFLLGAAVGRRRAAMLRLMHAASALGLAYSGVAIVQAIAGTADVLFIYTPQKPLYMFAGTLVNPNHAAAFLRMTVAVTLVLFAIETTRRKRLLYFVAFVVQASVLVLTPSGNALVAVPLIFGLFGGLYLLRRFRRYRRGGSSSRRVLGGRAFLVMAASAILVVVYVFVLRSGEPVGNDTLTTGKLDLFGHFASVLMVTNPLVGVGPGAFGDVYAALGPPLGAYCVSPESLVLRLIADYGVLLGILALFAGAYLLSGAVSRARLYRPASGLLLVLVLFVLHDLFDFAIEIPATGVLFFALLGAFANQRGDGRGAPISRRVSARVYLGMVLLLATVSAVASTGAERLLPHNEWRASGFDDRADDPRFFEEVLAKAAWYPLDLGVFLKVGAVAMRRGDLALANQVLRYAAEMAPRDSDVLRMLAKVSRVVNPRRHTALVVRLARDHWDAPHPRFRRSVPDFVSREVARTPSLSANTRLVFGSEHARVTYYLRYVMKRSEWPRDQLFRDCFEEYERSPDVLYVLYRLNLRLKDAELHTWIVDAVEERFSDHPRGLLMLGQERMRAGALDEAVAMFSEGLRKSGKCGELNCVLLYKLQVRLGRFEDAEKTLARMNGEGATLWSLQAHLALGRGETERALRLIEHVMVDTPNDVDALVLKTRVLLRAERYREALTVYELLDRLTDNPLYDEKAAALRRKLDADSRATPKG